MLFGIDSLYFWLAVIIISVAVEAFTLDLCAIWFAAGGVAALVAASCGVGATPQLLLFAVLSAVMLLLLRPFCRRFLKTGAQPTNADRIIGQTAVVSEPIDNLRETGAVRVLGKEWTARSADGSRIPRDTMVQIQAVSGVKLIVSKCKEE